MTGTAAQPSSFTHSVSNTSMCPRPSSIPGLRAFYEGSEHLKVMAGNGDDKLEPEALNGTNRLELYVWANEARRHAVLVARLDNLGKGASGAAVQNLRLMLDLGPGLN